MRCIEKAICDFEGNFVGVAGDPLSSIRAVGDQLGILDSGCGEALVSIRQTKRPPPSQTT